MHPHLYLFQSILIEENQTNIETLSNSENKLVTVKKGKSSYTSSLRAK